MMNQEIDGLVLVPFQDLPLEDIEKVRTWRNNNLIRAWMYNNNEITREEHEKFVRSLENNASKKYYLVKDVDDIGVIYFTEIKNKNAYFGIYVNPDVTAKGRGTLLTRTALKLAFDSMHLHTLKLEVFDNNKPAIGLYTKMGFKEEGRLREMVHRGGTWKDIIIMGVVNDKDR